MLIYYLILDIPHTMIKGSETMKHSKIRLTPREWAGAITGVFGLVGIFFEAPTPAGQALMALAGFTLIGLGAATYFWPEIKKSLKKEIAPSRAGTRTRRKENNYVYTITESEENVNLDMEAR